MWLTIAISSIISCDVENVTGVMIMVFFFFQAEDGIRDRSPSRGLGDVYKRQVMQSLIIPDRTVICWSLMICLINVFFMMEGQHCGVLGQPVLLHVLSTMKINRVKIKSISIMLINIKKTMTILSTLLLGIMSVSYTHLRAHETDSYLVCRLLLEKKKNRRKNES